MVNSIHPEKVDAFVLAGGTGHRLHLLTDERAKPAVYYGGDYRIIDFTLNNALNSEIREINVLTQYNAESLVTHLSSHWVKGGSMFTGPSIQTLFPIRRTSDDWYRGTADAIFYNRKRIEESDAEDILILSGDHVYVMDYRQMLAEHKKNNADLTISAVPVPVELAGNYGVLRVDKVGRIQQFVEKPQQIGDIPVLPDRNEALASMGVYLFNKGALLQNLGEEFPDFGEHVIPKMFSKRCGLFAYDFSTNHIEGNPVHGYWRDVGTLDQYFQGHMDLLNPTPAINFYNRAWPIHRRSMTHLPGAAVYDVGDFKSEVVNSMMSLGCIIYGASVVLSVLGSRVHVHEGSLIEESIVFPDVEIGERCKLRKTIVDRPNNIPSGTVIGYDAEQDTANGLFRAGDLVILPKNRYKQ